MTLLCLFIHWSLMTLKQKILMMHVLHCEKVFSTNFIYQKWHLIMTFLLETLDAFKHKGGQHLLSLIHLWLIGWLTFLMCHRVSLRIFHSVINCVLWKPPEHARYLGVGVGRRLRESPLVLSMGCWLCDLHKYFSHPSLVI